MLINDDSFSSIRAFHNNGLSYSQISLKKYQFATDKINSVVHELTLLDPEVSNKVHLNIGPKTLKEIVSENPKSLKNETDGRREKILNAILLYLEIPEIQWENYRLDNHKELKLLSEGYWYLYRFETDLNGNKSFRRTILEVVLKDNHRFARLKLLYSFFNNGKIVNHGSLVTIQFKNPQQNVNEAKSVEISLCITEKTVFDGNVFHGILRSTVDNYPFAKDCILAFSNDKDKKYDLNEMAILNYLSSEKIIKIENGTIKVNCTDDEKTFFEYLNRKSGGIVAKPFDPANIEGVKRRNKEFYEQFTKIAGLYFVYIPYAYDDKKSLLQIILEIDKFGKVIEKVLFEPDLLPEEEPLHYYGESQILNDSLRLSSINKHKQKSEYIFRISSSDLTSPTYLLGVTLDTDIKGFPCADACIALNKNLFDFPFEPTVISQQNPIYDLINNFFRENLSMSVEDYFFKYYPSIRRKIK